MWSLSATHGDTGPCTLCEASLPLMETLGLAHCAIYDLEPRGMLQVQSRSGNFSQLFFHFLEWPIDREYSFKLIFQLQGMPSWLNQRRWIDFLTENERPLLKQNSDSTTYNWKIGLKNNLSWTDSQHYRHKLACTAGAFKRFHTPWMTYFAFEFSRSGSKQHSGLQQGIYISRIRGWFSREKIRKFTGMPVQG